jgi:hypothetical protein
VSGTIWFSSWHCRFLGATFLSFVAGGCLLFWFLQLFHWFVQGLMHIQSFSRCHGVDVVIQHLRCFGFGVLIPFLGALCLVFFLPHFQYSFPFASDRGLVRALRSFSWACSIDLESGQCFEVLSKGGQLVGPFSIGCVKVFLLIVGAGFLQFLVSLRIVCLSDLVCLAFGVSVEVVSVAFSQQGLGLSLSATFGVGTLAAPIFCHYSQLIYCIFLCGLLASFWAPSGFYFLITLPMVGSCLRHLQNVIWFSSDE